MFPLDYCILFDNIYNNFTSQTLCIVCKKAARNFQLSHFRPFCLSTYCNKKYIRMWPLQISCCLFACDGSIEVVHDVVILTSSVFRFLIQGLWKGRFSYSSIPVVPTILSLHRVHEKYKTPTSFGSVWIVLRAVESLLEAPFIYSSDFHLLKLSHNQF